MSLLNDTLIEALKILKDKVTPTLVDKFFYRAGCGCTGNCGQSCSGGCLTSCSGNCGRSYSGNMS